MRPVELDPLLTREHGETVRLEKRVTVDLPTGYRSTLRQGTTWQLIGTLPYGKVYEPADSVLTVEGRHIREAYLVVKDGRLMGFYMPVEDAFSALPSPIPLRFSR